MKALLESVIAFGFTFVSQILVAKPKTPNARIDSSDWEHQRYASEVTNRMLELSRPFPVEEVLAPVCGAPHHKFFAVKCQKIGKCEPHELHTGQIRDPNGALRSVSFMDAEQRQAFLQCDKI
jgi:hypothetical protein